MRHEVIGVTGKAGSGKDTVGDWFIKEMGYEKLAMASALKAGLAAMGFPEPSDRAQKESKIEGFDFSWREAAQKLGQDFGRSLDKGIWLKLAEKRLKQGGRVIITDIRHDNEAEMVRSLGGTIIHLSGRQAELGEAAAHVSEAPIAFYPLFDLALLNTGTVQNLEDALRKIFK